MTVIWIWFEPTCIYCFAENREPPRLLTNLKNESFPNYTIYSSFWSVEPTNFKNVIQKKINWGLEVVFEVTPAKILKSSRFYDFSLCTLSAKDHVCNNGYLSVLHFCMYIMHKWHENLELPFIHASAINKMILELCSTNEL